MLMLYFEIVSRLLAKIKTDYILKYYNVFELKICWDSIVVILI